MALEDFQAKEETVDDAVLKIRKIKAAARNQIKTIKDRTNRQIAAVVEKYGKDALANKFGADKAEFLKVCDELPKKEKVEEQPQA